MVPNDRKPDFKQLKAKLLNFKQTELVNDIEEISWIIAETKALDPYVLEDKLFPGLR